MQATQLTSMAKLLATAVFAVFFVGLGGAEAAEVVALGSSWTFGPGVSRGEDYPAQLEQLLRAKGLKVSVANAGVNGDTTSGWKDRLAGALGPDTKVLVLQSNTLNDTPNHIDAAQTRQNLASIKATAAGRHIAVVMAPMSQDLPLQSDGIHMTSEGCHLFALRLLPKVQAALRH